MRTRWASASITTIIRAAITSWACATATSPYSPGPGLAGGVIPARFLLRRPVPHARPADMSQDLQQLFDAGLAAHQGGALASAEALYQRILAVEPRSFGA